MDTRVALILAPPDEGSTRLSRSGSFPPLGLLSLVTALRPHGIAATLFDGELLDVSQIVPHTDADIVGISVSQVTYANALVLARAAKARGAFVVFGGHHATALGAKILGNRPEVDAVIVGDGEDAFRQLALKRPMADIPNLIYRDGADIRTNRRVSLDPRLMLTPDRSLLNMHPYFANFRRQNPNKRFERPFSLFTQKGCGWRDRSGGCSFCARTDLGWRARAPGQAWQEIESLVQDYGADYIWELSDDILSSEEWLRLFATSRPRGIAPAFLCYARPAGVTARTADLLAQLGTYEAFLGVETGADSILRSVNKGSTTRTNLRAAHLLKERGIRIFPSFVLGLEGETTVTLRQTERLMLELLEGDLVDAVAVSILMPLPGSSDYSRLASVTELRHEFEADHIDLTVLQTMWCERSCGVTLPELEEWRSRLLEYVPVGSGIGTRRRESTGSSSTYSNARSLRIASNGSVCAAG